MVLREGVKEGEVRCFLTYLLSDDIVLKKGGKNL